MLPEQSSGPAGILTGADLQRSKSPSQSGTVGLQAQEETSLVPAANVRHPIAGGLEFTRPTGSPITDLRERCLEAFFHYFNPAHPFLPPKTYLLEILKTRSLRHLEAAMRYVGSCYVKTAPTDYIAQETLHLLFNNDCPRDGFTVQAMLLMVIGLDGHSELKKAVEILTQAQDLALEIGMHQREYAVIHGEGLAIMEESWRRTWWELYIVDGMIAGVHQQSSFRLNEIMSNVLLPCEEQEYLSNVSCPVPAPSILLIC